MTWLAITAIANMAIGLFYCVRFIAEMYFETLARRDPIAGAIGYAAGLALTVVGTLVFGIAPSAVLSLSNLGKLFE
jgi:NADH:ubiquinone oxidoreductase subunit 2 (subunit N)